MRWGICASLWVATWSGAALGASNDIIGRWDLQVEPGGYPSWIGVSSDGSLRKVEFLWMGGGVENPPEKAKVVGNTVSFRARDMNWVGSANGDVITGTATEDNGKVSKFTGARFVADVDVTGTWALKLDGRSEKEATISLLQSGSQIAGTYKAKQQLPVSDAQVSDGVLSFKVTSSGGDVQRVEGRVEGDQMAGTVTIHGNKRKFTAERRREWSTPVDLFNGKDLTGWKSPGDAKRVHWKAVDHVLTNSDRGSNLVSEKTFRDFKLHVEFRVPKHSNSGVYLRGRYEVQVDDSYGKKPYNGACGAIYGRLAPSENASKPADEWQTFDITLVGQYVTVVQNGKKIIDNRELEGITGGALDVNEHDAGPLYFQGDHGSVEYRKIRIQTPAEPIKTAKK